MFGKDKYIWKKISRRYSFWSQCYFEDETWDDLDYFNFNAYFRRKRNWKSYLINYYSAKQYEKEYNINLKLRRQKFIETDSWAYEEYAKAYHERKSWKRNSKKKFQWENTKLP